MILREVDNGKGMEEVCREHNIANRPPMSWKAAAGQFAIQFETRFFSSAS